MKNITMKKLIIIAIVLVPLLLTLSGCGYRLAGHGKQIPDHIRTIYIPDFDNKTTRMQAEQFVTFAVRDEFIQRSDLKLVNRREDADAILEGEIKVFNVVPVSYDDHATANLYKLAIVLSVRFIDLKDSKIIFEGANIGFNDTYNIDDQDFFSQETEKLIEISEKFAESVVTSILENF